MWMKTKRLQFVSRGLHCVFIFRPSLPKSWGNDVGTILSHFHWRILRLSAILEKNHSLTHSLTDLLNNIGLRDASASKNKLCRILSHPKWSLPTGSVTGSLSFQHWFTKKGSVYDTEYVFEENWNFRVWGWCKLNFLTFAPKKCLFSYVI